MTDDRWQLFKSEKGGEKYLYIKLIIYINGVFKSGLISKI